MPVQLWTGCVDHEVFGGRGFAFRSSVVFAYSVEQVSGTSMQEAIVKRSGRGITAGLSTSAFAAGAASRRHRRLRTSAACLDVTGSLPMHSVVLNN
jgi:hypothetical protein